MTSPARPRPRWCHSRSGLGGLSIVSWRIEAARLHRSLPDGFQPVTHEHDGGEYGVVSLVAFVDLDFHFNFAPPIQLSCGQINYRAYVRHGDEEGVFFYGTSLASRLVKVPQVLWEMPWHNDRVQVSATWNGDEPAKYGVDAQGRWGDARIRLRALREGDLAQAGSGGLNALGDPQLISDRYVDPTIGWYQRRRGGIGRYGVWHDPMKMSPMAIDEASSKVFSDLQLVDHGDLPFDARVTKRTTFDIHTPPLNEGS